MKYLSDEPFSTGVPSDAYRDNYDRIFAPEPEKRHSLRYKPSRPDVIECLYCSKRWPLPEYRQGPSVFNESCPSEVCFVCNVDRGVGCSCWDVPGDDE